MTSESRKSGLPVCRARLIDALVWLLAYGGIGLLYFTEKIDAQGLTIIFVVGIGIGGAVAVLRASPGP